MINELYRDEVVGLDKYSYTYLQQMHQFIQSQEQRIRTLEKTINTILKDIKNLQSRPPVQVGTIQYSFDQLKVETLEGTLNIGLNPSDLENIENYEVDQQPFSQRYFPKDQMEITMSLENTIYDYLDRNLESIIQNCGKELNVQVDDSYAEFIKEDIKKQLPYRIDHYFKTFQMEPGSSKKQEQIINDIEQQLKTDIQKAVWSFLRNVYHKGKD